MIEGERFCLFDTRHVLIGRHTRNFRFFNVVFTRLVVRHVLSPFYWACAVYRIHGGCCCCISVDVIAHVRY